MLDERNEANMKADRQANIGDPSCLHLLTFTTTVMTKIMTFISLQVYEVLMNEFEIVHIFYFGVFFLFVFYPLSRFLSSAAFLLGSQKASQRHAATPV